MVLGTWRAASRTSPARPRPTDRTSRRPTGRPRRAHAISASSRPAVGQATRMPAVSRVKPSFLSAGIRYARPYWNVHPAVSAARPTNKISQRRRGGSGWAGPAGAGLGWARAGVGSAGVGSAGVGLCWRGQCWRGQCWRGQCWRGQCWSRVRPGPSRWERRSGGPGHIVILDVRIVRQRAARKDRCRACAGDNPAAARRGGSRRVRRGRRSSAGRGVRRIAAPGQHRPGRARPGRASREGADGGFGRRFGRQRRQPGFVLAEARHGGYLVGYAFGVPLRPATSWWRDLTAPLPEELTAEHPGRTFALAELTVRAAWRRQGIGRDLHDLILDGRAEDRATAAIPAAAGPAQGCLPALGLAQSGPQARRAARRRPARRPPARPGRRGLGSVSRSRVDQGAGIPRPAGQAEEERPWLRDGRRGNAARRDAGAGEPARDLETGPGTGPAGEPGQVRAAGGKPLRRGIRSDRYARAAGWSQGRPGPRLESLATAGHNAGERPGVGNEAAGAHAVLADTGRVRR